MILLAAFTSLASAQQNDVTSILEVLDVTNGLFPLGTEPFGLVCRGAEDDRFDPCNLYGLCDANVVYLCADRTLSVYAGLFRMGGKGVG